MKVFFVLFCFYIYIYIYIYLSTYLTSGKWMKIHETLICHAIQSHVDSSNHETQVMQNNNLNIIVQTFHSVFTKKKGYMQKYTISAGCHQNLVDMAIATDKALFSSENC